MTNDYLERVILDIDKYTRRHEARLTSSARKANFSF